MSYESSPWDSDIITAVGKHAKKCHLWPAAILVLYAYSVRELRLDRPYAFGDYVPYIGIRSVIDFLSSWQYGLLGFKQTPSTYELYLGALTSIGGASMHTIIYIATLPAAFLTFRYFLVRFTSYEPARSLGAGVYAFNPVTISKFANGGWNELITVIGIPLVAVYLYAYIDTGERDNLVYAAAIFGATTIILWTAFWLVLPVATALLIQSYPERTKIKNLVATGFGGVVLTIPNVYYLLLRAEGLTSLDQYFQFISFNYGHATFPALLRLAGNKGGLAILMFNYNTDPLYAIGFVIPLIGLIGLSDRRTWPYALAALVAATFAVGTRLELTYPLFRLFPPLFSLRNPNKLLYIIMFAEALMFAIGVNLIYGTLTDALQKLPGDRLRLHIIRMSFIALLCLSLMVYIAPANGSFGVNDAREDGYFIPEEYDAVADQLDGRVLWLPYTYTTQLRLRHTYPSHVGVRGGSPSRGNTERIERLFRDISRKQPVYQQLRDLGVTYVIIDSTSNGRFDSHQGTPRLENRRLTPWLYGNPDTIRQRFESSGRYEKALTTGRITVFRVKGTSATETKRLESGFHQVYYPRPDSPNIGVNKVQNAEFRSGTDHWWTARNSPTTVTPVLLEGNEHGLRLMTQGPPSEGDPIAQEIPTTPGTNYSISVETQKNESVNTFLFWYDGKKKPDNLITSSKYAPSELPTEVTAKGTTLSLRVKSTTTTATVTDVRVHNLSKERSFADRGVTEASAGVPGVTVDGYQYNTSAGTVVAVNLQADEADSVDADVRVTDAETTLNGTVIYDDRYRQEMAIKTTVETFQEETPPNATVHAIHTDDGVIVDYWQVGTYGSTSTTVVDQSYHPGWKASTNATHLKLDWKNAFVGASPADVAWRGDAERPFVLAGWGLSWICVVGIIVYRKVNNTWGSTLRRYLTSRIE